VALVHFWGFDPFRFKLSLPIVLSFDESKAPADEAHQGSKASKFDKNQVIVFKTTQQRNEMTEKLRQLFLYNTGKALLVKRDQKFEDTKEASLEKRAPVLAARLLKLTTGFFGKHVRLIRFYDDGVIEWSENETSSKQYKEVVLAVNSDDNALKTGQKKVDGEQKNCVFHLKTSGKSLLFVADNAAQKGEWVEKISAVVKEVERRKADEEERKKDELKKKPTAASPSKDKDKEKAIASPAQKDKPKEKRGFWS